MPNQSTDLIPYLFIAIVVIAGGFVAYVADGLGRKLGKKRLSFFGLRPRHTATLMTVGAGILIPILTILAIYALSSDAREWIQKGRGAIREAKEKTKQVDQLDNKVKGLQGQQAKLQGQVTGLSQQTVKLTAQVSEQRKSLLQSQKDLADARAKSNKAAQSIHALEGKVSQKSKEISAKSLEIGSIKKEIAQKKKDLAKASSQASVASGRANEAMQEQTRLLRDLAKLEDDLKAKTNEFNGLESQRNELTTQIGSLRETISAYRETISNYEQEIKTSQEKLSTLQNAFANNVLATRTKPMIFEADEELARVQLPPSLSPTAARTAYFDVLQRARTVALDRKARDSASLPPAGLFEIDAGQGQPRISVEEQENAIIRGLIAQRSELVLIARAQYNAFEGEYVVLEFVGFRNKPVYREGQVIAEARIDGRRQEVEIFNAIQTFLSQTVRAQALKDGMIPPTGRNASLGTVENDDLLALIHNIKSENQNIRLQAVAKSDTKAGDQLELTFRIRY